jgi:mannose-6-phosphate isomerase-like protein (cupin superfamily)
MKVLDLARAFDTIDDHWKPRILGRMNDCELKVVKFAGDFVWHHHDDTDECFFVIAGTMHMGIRDDDGERELIVGPGQLVVIPKNVEHCPRAPGECAVVLFERAGTVNTGSAGGERTVVATDL